MERTAKLLIETNGNVSKAMRMAGYPATTARNPQQITKAKGFTELLEKYLPESHLLAKHRTFLDSKRVVKTFRKGDLMETIEETDPAAVKALDMAYKLKGKYQDKAGNSVLIINVSGQAQARYAQRPVQAPPQDYTVKEDIEGHPPS